MEIGSKEHRHLLMKSIIKVATKTTLIGFLVGMGLILPSLVRENAFSNGLSIIGQAVIGLSLIYSLVIAFKKYRQTLGKLDQ